MPAQTLLPQLICHRLRRTRNRDCGGVLVLSGSSSSSTREPAKRPHRTLFSQRRCPLTGGWSDKINCAATVSIADGVFDARYEPATHVVNLKLHGPLPANASRHRDRGLQYAALYSQQLWYRQHRPVQLFETCIRGGSCRSAAKRQMDATAGSVGRPFPLRSLFELCHTALTKMRCA